MIQSDFPSGPIRALLSALYKTSVSRNGYRDTKTFVDSWFMTYGIIIIFWLFYLIDDFLDKGFVLIQGWGS